MKMDEGFMYGLGAFETIAVEKGIPILLDKHLSRLNRTLDFLMISKRITEEEITERLSGSRPKVSREVMKIMVSYENTIYKFRKNLYREEDYRAGFRLRYSDVLRNDTSQFTYHKTLNYGDSILEKRKSKEYHDAVFLNRRNEICEGAITNIFFVENGRISTPKISCGLLPGTMRSFILEHYDVEETIIFREETCRFTECFVTNALLGIMPVSSLGDVVFKERSTAFTLREEYLQFFDIEV